MSTAVRLKKLEDLKPVIQMSHLLLIAIVVKRVQRGGSFLCTEEYCTGGGGSQFTYQLFGGIGFQLTRHFSLTGGYRHLKVDYDKDGFLFDVALHGPVFGMGIKF